VFTRERRSIRRFFENGTRNFSDRETNNARKIARAIADIARSGCDAAVFVKHAFDEASRVEVIAGRRSGADRLCADSESRFLAIKKFFAISGLGADRRSPNPVFFRSNRSPPIRQLASFCTRTLSLLMMVNPR